MRSQNNSGVGSSLSHVSPRYLMQRADPSIAAQSACSAHTHVIASQSDHLYCSFTARSIGYLPVKQSSMRCLRQSHLIVQTQAGRSDVSVARARRECDNAPSTFSKVHNRLHVSTDLLTPLRCDMADYCSRLLICARRCVFKTQQNLVDDHPQRACRFEIIRGGCATTARV